MIIDLQVQPEPENYIQAIYLLLKWNEVVYIIEEIEILFLLILNEKIIIAH
ncbi:MAG: hypothetical protein ACD_4C00112G0001 [uncultured bacterium (gcode 4)]|uniref:Uncharacterized protein n=1 Tax=uncultured bacterium (gcode 4) TaxID=1234023 RepID=K2F729_9BACT|nr:MAG: hypothetical protein ACD_4C00112G0001 [uncultured bacterium (gcode 4)]